MRTLTGNLGFGSMKNTSNTKLLIHSNTTNASTSFTDSASGHTVTASADAQHKTDQKKWGKTSMYFDGTGDYLTIPDHDDFALGTSDFTIDFWIRFGSVDITQPICEQLEDSYNYTLIRWESGYIFFYHYSSGVSNISKAGAWTPVVNTWYHVAVIRGWGGDSTVFEICVNGKALGLGGVEADTIDDLSADFKIGIWSNGPDYFNGHIDEFRLVKGEALWTTNFIPPAGPYS